MKTNLALLAVISLAISACSTPPKETTVQTPYQATATDSRQPSTDSAPAADTGSSELAAQLLEMQKSSVYFDFDEFAIKPEYREVVHQHAQFIKKQKALAIKLEGHADERGSSEYNLSLGDRRANAVRKSLEVLGVPGGQIHTVSMGEESPRLACHEEKCWKKNRRVDFIGKQN